jgi:hypothetical protein
MRRARCLESVSAHGAAATALAALALLAAGCEEAPPEEKPREARVVVKLSFDETVYVDAAAPPRKVFERVRHQTKSIFPALKKADVTVAARKQANLDISSLSRERVTVVDAATGITRSALRVRYHFVAAALAPREVAAKRGLALGVLHDVNAARADAILAECTANGDRERGSVSEPWLVFDSSLPSCAAAMAREEAAVVAARKDLQHPGRELASVEFERSYLPLEVHLELLHPAAGRKPAGDAPSAAATGEVPAPPAVAAVPAVPGPPGTAGPFPPRAPAVAAPSAAVAPVPVAAERDLAAEIPADDRGADPDVAAPVELDEDLRKDEAELFATDHSAAVFAGYGEPGAAAPVVSHSSPYLQPNFAILYVAIAAVAALLVGKNRRTS